MSLHLLTLFLSPLTSLTSLLTSPFSFDLTNQNGVRCPRQTGHQFPLNINVKGTEKRLIPDVHFFGFRTGLRERVGKRSLWVEEEGAGGVDYAPWRDNPDLGVNGIERRHHKASIASMLSLFVPGAGQFYNYQVAKSLYVFFFFLLSFGITLVHFLLFTLLPLVRKYLLVVSSPLLDQTRRVTNLLPSRSSSPLSIGFEEALLSFPAPPLSHTLLLILDHLLQHRLLVAATLLLVLIVSHALQIVDAYRTGRLIEEGKQPITHSRKQQLLRILALTFLPYLLMILPIPGAAYLGGIFFESLSASLEQFLDGTGTRTSKGCPEDGSLPMDGASSFSAWNELKRIVLAKTLEFVQYSILILLVVLYCLWYSSLIACWVFRLFF